jgi:hypothetical protein
MDNMRDKYNAALAQIEELKLEVSRWKMGYKGAEV